MEVFEGKTWISGQGLVDACIGVSDGKITAVKKILEGDKHTVFQGVILPAAFDMHVHFRDPGYPHKEDWASGSVSAACGGVTAVVDMPNTNPFTSDLETFEEILGNVNNKGNLSPGFESEFGDEYMKYPNYGLHRLRFIKDE